MGKTQEDRAYQKGLERGREGCADAKGMFDTLVDGVLETMSLGLIKEPDSVRRAQEGGFAFGKENPAAPVPEEPAAYEEATQEDSYTYDAADEWDDYEDDEDDELENEHEEGETIGSDESESDDTPTSSDKEFNEIQRCEQAKYAHLAKALLPNESDRPPMQIVDGWNYLSFPKTTTTTNEYIGLVVKTTTTTYRKTAFFLDEATRSEFIRVTRIWPGFAEGGDQFISCEQALLLEEISQKIYGKAPFNMMQVMRDMLILRKIDPDSEIGQEALKGIEPPKPPTQKHHETH